MKKRERLVAKRALLAPGEESVALDTGIKATAEMIARRVAVAQRATEPVGGEAEWVPRPDAPGESEIVDLRNGAHGRTALARP